MEIDGLDPAQRREFLAGMPLPARMLWRLIGHRRWSRERDALYAR